MAEHPTTEPQSPEPQSSDLDEARMPFLEHLRELRTRLRNSAIALTAGFAAALFFKEEIYVFLARPLFSIWREMAAQNPAVGEPALYFKSLIEPFWTYFSMAFWAGIFVASPFIFYQVWKFIAPGLYKRERRYGVAFAVFSAIMFIAGATFAYSVVLEPVYTFLIGFADQDLAEVKRELGIEYRLAEAMPLKPHLFMEEYLAFSKKLLIGFGLVFELPLLIMFMSLAGMVTHRSLWKFNRWALVLAFVASATLTPPDIYSQILMAGPIIVLYNFSIIISWVITWRRESRERNLDGDDSTDYVDEVPPADDGGGGAPDA